jgi:hypothetical protein
MNDKDRERLEEGRELTWVTFKQLLDSQGIQVQSEDTEKVIRAALIYGFDCGVEIGKLVEDYSDVGDDERLSAEKEEEESALQRRIKAVRERKRREDK